ncbi:MAG: hypothetical protein FD126_3352, partial [Elusimicrobia bacterium]
AGAASHTAQWDAATPGGGAITGGGAGGMSNGGAFSGEEGVGSGGPLDQNSTSTNDPNDVKKIDNAKNVTPYQSQLDMAKGMLMLASAIIIVIGIICAVRNESLTIPIVGTAVAAGLTTTMNVFLGIALALGAGAAAIGASIASGHGQGQQGGIIAMGGTITAATAAASMLWPGTVPSWVLILAGVAGMAMPLMGGGGGKTADRSDIGSNG